MREFLFLFTHVIYVQYPFKPREQLTLFDLTYNYYQICLESKMHSCHWLSEFYNNPQTPFFWIICQLWNTLLSELFNGDHNQKLSDNFLCEIANKNEENYDCFKKMLKLPPASLQFRLSKGSSDASHAMAHLQLFCWRETTEGTKECLKSRMDEFSVFAGRNPLVRMAY